MALEPPIRRLREFPARVADSFVWYCRTRPDAARSLVAPGIGVVLTMWISIAWGALGFLLALAIVASFAVFAVGLLEELRTAEAEQVRVELDAKHVPWLAQLSEEEPPEVLAAGAAEEETRLPLLAQLSEEAPPHASAEIRPAETEEPEPAPAVEVPEPFGVEPVEVPAAAPLRAAATGRMTRPVRDVPRRATGEHAYELREVVSGGHRALKSAPSFLEACDLAFDVIEDSDPAELEIVRVAGDRHKTVWTYRRGQPHPTGGRPQQPVAAPPGLARWARPPETRVTARATYVRR